MRFWLALLFTFIVAPALAAGTPVEITADSFVID